MVFMVVMDKYHKQDETILPNYMIPKFDISKIIPQSNIQIICKNENTKLNLITNITSHICKKECKYNNSPYKIFEESFIKKNIQKEKLNVLIIDDFTKNIKKYINDKNFEKIFLNNKHLNLMTIFETNQYYNLQHLNMMVDYIFIFNDNNMNNMNNYNSNDNSNDNRNDNLKLIYTKYISCNSNIEYDTFLELFDKNNCIVITQNIPYHNYKNYIFWYNV